MMPRELIQEDKPWYRPTWPTPPKGLTAWLGFFATLAVVVTGAVALAAQTIGLDTKAEREAAVSAVIEAHSADMGEVYQGIGANSSQLDRIERAVLCTLWEVEPETCALELR